MTEKEYISQFSTEVNQALSWLEKETHIRTNHPRMLSGQDVGHLLNFLVKETAAGNILEIGVFTGYSSICLACGLGPDGHLDALEINDELEDLILNGYRRAGVSEKITLRFGDAKEIIPTLGSTYDLVYIDADKREYPTYYRMVFDKVRVGGLIIADNVLWDGKVFADNVPQDAQTMGIYNFNKTVAEDPRVNNFILPIRDGLNIIKKIR
ncbi:MAG: class I SAM-dependent methyltransferase [Bacteroidales bacterium]|nr:class I SAM-dependent methyltransferase [Bacteroidales bacterium]